MTTIYIARKHKIAGYRWSGYKDAYHTAFQIHGAYATKQEAKSVVDIKNLKAKDYIYTIGKVVVK